MGFADDVPFNDGFSSVPGTDTQTVTIGAPLEASGTTPGLADAGTSGTGASAGTAGAAADAAWQPSPPPSIPIAPSGSSLPANFSGALASILNPPQNGGWLRNALGVDPNTYQQAMAGLGRGMATTQGNTAGAAFARGFGGALQGADQAQAQQQTRKLAALQALIHAWQAGDMSAYRQAMIDWRNLNTQATADYRNAQLAQRRPPGGGSAAAAAPQASASPSQAALAPATPTAPNDAPYAAPASAASASGAALSIDSKDAYSALPVGAPYIAPDGSTRIKQ